MAFNSWEPVVAAIRRRLEPADDRLTGLALRVGVTLEPSWPREVAVAAVRDATEPVLLDDDRPDEASEAQLQFLERLLEKAPRQRPVQCETRRVVSAWINVLLSDQTSEILEHMRLRRGDIVDHDTYGRLSNEARTPFLMRYEVSSIRDDGLVYFRGGNGRCGWPSRIELVARGGTPEAVQPRPLPSPVDLLDAASP